MLDTVGGLFAALRPRTCQAGRTPNEGITWACARCSQKPATRSSAIRPSGLCGAPALTQDRKVYGAYGAEMRDLRRLRRGVGQGRGRGVGVGGGAGRPN